MGVSGPMFEPKKTDFRESIFNKDGGHYNIFRLGGARGPVLPEDDENIWNGIQSFFPDGEANDLNFVLFSTSGVHGSYTTLDEIEASLKKHGDLSDTDMDKYPDDYVIPEVTILIVQTRIVALSYGNLKVTLERLPFLKRLRATSWAAAIKVGK